MPTLRVLAYDFQVKKDKLTIGKMRCRLNRIQYTSHLMRYNSRALDKTGIRDLARFGECEIDPNH